jgi:pyridoxine 5-phosphate synthase
MTLLSVNLNKIALVRNARGGSDPDVLAAAETCLDAGAGGVTVHPRPDQRHARPDDVRRLADLTRARGDTEFNVEGNPFPDFLELVYETSPTQCTLVPDAPEALTSDHGWDLEADGERLGPIVRGLADRGVRVSLFLDPDLNQVGLARELGVARIELYTEPYAQAFGTDREATELARFSAAATFAQECGLGVNAGHDLSLLNLGAFLGAVPNVLEVSIGHALISHALDVGLRCAVLDYMGVIGAVEHA